MTKVDQINELNTKSWEIMVSSPVEGLSSCEEALKLSREIKNEILEGNSLLNKGWCKIYLGLYNEAIVDLNISSDIYKKHGDIENQIKALNGLGVANFYKSRYSRAIDYYSQCLLLSRNIGNKEREFVSLVNIGEVYLESEEYDDALKFFTEARSIDESCFSKEHFAQLLNYIGLAYRNLGLYENARKNLETALTIARNINNALVETESLRITGLTCIDEKDFSTAEDILSKSLSISLEKKDRLGEVKTKFSLAEAYFLQNNNEKSYNLYKEVFYLSKMIGSDFHHYKSAFILSGFEEKAGNISEAFRYYKVGYETEKKVYSLQANKKLLNISDRYEIERSYKEAEINRLKNIELKNAYNKINNINIIGKKITSSLEFENITKTLFESLKEIFHTDSLCLSIYNSKKKEIINHYLNSNSTGIIHDRVPFNDKNNFTGLVVSSKKAIMINDKEREIGIYLEKPYYELIKTGSSIYSPLIIEDRILGVVSLHSDKIDSFSLNQSELIEMLSPNIAIAIENSIIHRKAKELNIKLHKEKTELEKAINQIKYNATHDILTDLANRSLLSEFLNNIISRSFRYNDNFAVLYMDLDNFKPINDTAGHEAGDFVLKETANRLKSLFRTSDIIARVGGDEFIAVIQSFNSRDDIENKCKRIIERIQEPIKYRSEAHVIGVSIGISIFPDDGTISDKLLNRADNAMYKIKQTTKNSYAFYS